MTLRKITNDIRVKPNKRSPKEGPINDLTNTKLAKEHNERLFEKPSHFTKKMIKNLTGEIF